MIIYNIKNVSVFLFYKMKIKNNNKNVFEWINDNYRINCHSVVQFIAIANKFAEQFI